jgi:hypothetical protein
MTTAEEVLSFTRDKLVACFGPEWQKHADAQAIETSCRNQLEWRLPRFVQEDMQQMLNAKIAARRGEQ